MSALTATHTPELWQVAVDAARNAAYWKAEAEKERDLRALECVQPPSLPPVQGTSGGGVDVGLVVVLTIAVAVVAGGTAGLAGYFAGRSD
jgi:hypothetical protein